MADVPAAADFNDVTVLHVDAPFFLLVDPIARTVTLSSPTKPGNANS